MKYVSKITGMGPDALSFLDDADTNFIIIFNDTAPAELAEISVLHTQAEVMGDVCVGDTMKICNQVYKISAIGDEALHTLRTLGHCTLDFKGGDVPERPGCIMLEGEAMHAANMKAGLTIEIYE